MKKLLFVLLVSVFVAGCSKEDKQAEYIVTVTGDDYSDDLYIQYKNHSNFNSSYLPLSLSGGEATISGYRKCTFQFIFHPYSVGSFPYAPQHQTEGDVIHISLFQKKKNGSKGDKLGGLSMTCTELTETNVIEVEW